MLAEVEGAFCWKRNTDRGRDRVSSAVNIPSQTKLYTSKFDKINKQNLNDAKYNLRAIQISTTGCLN
jgi:hypothetical protein